MSTRITKLIHDPGRRALHRAVRVIIVAGSVFAVGLEVIGNDQFAVYGFFGAFALLGFGDFGGTPAERTRSYLSVTAIGASLIVVGTAVSATWWLAALVMLAVGFATRFAGFFGGAFQAAVSPVILAYVLAATSPAAFGDVGARVIGWLVAGVASTVIALVIWPGRQRSQLAAAAAVAASELADVVEARATSARAASEPNRRVESALLALDAEAAVPLRPAGPGEPDAAMRFVVDELRRIGALVTEPPFSDIEVAPSAEVTALAELSAGALRASAASLRGEPSLPEPDVIEAAREHDQQLLFDRAEAALVNGGAPSEVLNWLDDAFVLRMVGFLSASVAANTVTWRGASAPHDHELVFPVEQPCDLAGRVRGIIRSHLDPRSVWFQDSIKAALALGLAVAVAGFGQFEHGFWVVLGTLSVLRSNAFDTGLTAVQAAGGTAVGFAASILVFAVVGFDRPSLWFISMTALFLAAYVPQAMNFVAGQMAFTVAVVTAFNLVQPQGWQTGLVRFRDIAVGAGISFVVALVFWPRRADREIRSTVTALYAELAALVPAAVRALPDGRGVDPSQRERVAEREHRARAALVNLTEEAAGRPERIHPWDRYLLLAALVRTGVQTFEHNAWRAGDGSCRPAFVELELQACRIGEALGHLPRLADGDDGDIAEPAHDGGLATSLATATRAVTEAGLAGHEDGPLGDCSAALAVALCREWLVAIAHALDRTVPDRSD